MTSRPYAVVDVFADSPPNGNPLAVVVDGDGVDDAAMQRYANWTNLSETTFLLPPTDPGADYLVRIFTPDRELPFAGHPTLGSCHAWLAAGNTPRTPGMVVQECGAGLIPIRLDGDRPAFKAPPQVRSGPLDDATLDKVVGELRISRDRVLDAAWIDNGPGWLGLLLPDAETVLAVEPGLITEEIGLIGFHPDGGGPGGAAYEVRAFFIKGGATGEDPVTGSLNASAAQWMVATGRVAGPRFTVSQGRAIGRDGRVAISVDGDDLWVGGTVATVVTGTVEL